VFKAVRTAKSSGALQIRGARGVVEQVTLSLDGSSIRSSFGERRAAYSSLTSGVNSSESQRRPASCSSVATCGCADCRSEAQRAASSAQG
ncbi:hypothetical protein Dimus_007953, partial [Dionaea muscipula]